MMAKIKDILWALIGGIIIVCLIVFAGKKGTKVLDNLDKKQSAKEKEVKNDLEKMSDNDIVHKYGDIKSAQRIINKSGNRLADRGRTLLSRLGSQGVRIQDIDRDRIGHIGGSDKEPG